MVDVSDTLVVVVVVLGRLVLPLLIPRFPLPAVLACLLLDGVDQTIFQQWTSLDLEGYQSYDKALDIYYLALAYLATLRNWTNRTAFRLSRFLLYYRLVGVVAFELTQVRALLLFFPNTFEYFFIFYEAVRTRFDPRRMSAAFVVAAAAGIWVFVKVPQEYWIHIAKLDTTDLLKEEVFGVPVDASWGEAVSNRPTVVVAVLVALAVAVIVLRRLVVPRLPAPDHGWRFAADPMPEQIDEPQERAEHRARHHRFLDPTLLEKVALVALVSIVFAEMLPNVTASPTQVTIGVAVLVAVNSFLGLWRVRRGHAFQSLALGFGALAAANLLLVLVADWALGAARGDLRLGTTLFFVLLLTLIVTLYDRYRPVAEVRFAPAR